MRRVCSQCGAVINRYHLGNLCFPCQEKKLEEETTGGQDIIDGEGYASILGLESAESVKRLARKGLLAPRIPGVKKWLWRKDDIDAWFKREQQAGDVFRMAARGIASNLRTCRNDSVICLSLSDKIRTQGIRPGACSRDNRCGASRTHYTGASRYLYSLKCVGEAPEEGFSRVNRYHRLG